MSSSPFTARPQTHFVRILLKLSSHLALDPAPTLLCLCFFLCSALFWLSALKALFHGSHSSGRLLLRAERPPGPYSAGYGIFSCAHLALCQDWRLA